jgi:hypothetical protein
VRRVRAIDGPPRGEYTPLTECPLFVGKSTLDPDRLAILADALEDAGCDNTDILSHLRGQGPHVRGCWVVDLLLGKE